jgi:hypothetical protein
VAVVVVVSIARGHDASYPFKSIGAADSATITAKRGAGRYESAVERVSEPVGIWQNKVQTVRPGEWRAIDSRCRYRAEGAGYALAAFALKIIRASRFGFDWAYRPVSKSRVIAGFAEHVIAQSPPAEITQTALALAEEHQCQHGHAPNKRAPTSIRQFDKARTRKSTEAGPLDFAQLLREREHLSRDAELRTLRDLARQIWSAQPARTPKHAQTESYAQTRGQNSTGWPRGLRHWGKFTRTTTRRDGRRSRAGARGRVAWTQPARISFTASASTSPTTPSARTSNTRGRWPHSGLDSEHLAAGLGPAASHVTHSSEVQCDRW